MSEPRSGSDRVDWGGTQVIVTIVLMNPTLKETIGVCSGSDSTADGETPSGPGRYRSSVLKWSGLNDAIRPHP